MYTFVATQVAQLLKHLRICHSCVNSTAPLNSVALIRRERLKPQKTPEHPWLCVELTRARVAISCHQVRASTRYFLRCLVCGIYDCLNNTVNTFVLLAFLSRICLWVAGLGSAGAGSWLKEFEECKELAQEVVQLIQVSKNCEYNTTIPASSKCYINKGCDPSSNFSRRLASCDRKPTKILCLCF